MNKETGRYWGLGSVSLLQTYVKCERLSDSLVQYRSSRRDQTIPDRKSFLLLAATLIVSAVKTESCRGTVGFQESFRQKSPVRQRTRRDSSCAILQVVSTPRMCRTLDLLSAGSDDTQDIGGKS